MMGGGSFHIIVGAPSPTYLNGRQSKVPVVPLIEGGQVLPSDRKWEVLPSLNLQIEREDIERGKLHPSIESSNLFYNGG